MSAFLGGWRLALRLARREAWRRKGQTILMLVLIGLPVLAVTAAAVVWQTARLDGDVTADRRMGAAEALVVAEPHGGQVIQHFDPGVASWAMQGKESPEHGPTLADVRAVLGDDRPAAAYDTVDWSFASTHGEAWLEFVEVDLADPLAAGLFRHEAGAAVPGPGEVLVNRALLDRGPEVGGSLMLGSGEDAQQLTIVGVAEHSHVRSYPVAVAGPGTVEDQDRVGHRGSWLIGGSPVTWDDVRALNAIGVAVHSRHVLINPPPQSELPEELRGWGEESNDELIAVVGLIIAMVLIEVVLLAGPAFAVRARQQAHSLALLGASGGTPTQTRRVVVATSVLVGGLAGLIGAVLGVALGWALLPAAQLAFWNWLGPFDIPWSIIAVVGFFGLLSAVLAAAVPAVIAARQDVVAVLSGRRGEGRPSLASPLLGVLVLGGGIAAAVVGSGWQESGTGALLIASAAIVSVIGMILLVPVVVVLVARVAARMPLPIRFSARDAARHRSRTVPAVAAVAATVAGVVALGIALSSDEAENRETYAEEIPLGHAVVSGGHETRWAEVERIVTNRLPEPEIGFVVGTLEDHGEDGRWSYTETTVGGDPAWNSSTWAYGAEFIVAEQVPPFVAMADSDRQRADAALGAGGAVVLAGREDHVNSGDSVELVRVMERDGQHVDEELGRVAVPGAMVQTDRQWAPARAIIAPGVAAELGLDVGTTALLVSTAMDTGAEQDIAEAITALEGAQRLYVERGYQPEPMVQLVQWILAALGGVLMLGGTLTATFLALSDARPDLATMAAVGARPRTRRSVAASYALVVGFVGAALGALVGFIPGLAITRPLTIGSGTHYIDIPWLMITAVVLGLPLLTAAVVGLFARSRLPMVARID